MDFEHIHLLLDVIHKSLNLPNTNRIRDLAMAELTSINAVPAPNAAPPVPAPLVTPRFEEGLADENVQGELNLKGRRL
jgi:hypothetical protein